MSYIGTRVGAVEVNALFIVICVTEQCLLYASCVCLSVCGICAQLCCWVNLQTMGAVIRQMLPWFLHTREGGQENPVSQCDCQEHEVTVSKDAQITPCSNGMNALLLLQPQGTGILLWIFKKFWL